MPDPGSTAAAVKIIIDTFGSGGGGSLSPEQYVSDISTRLRDLSDTLIRIIYEQNNETDDLVRWYSNRIREDISDTNLSVNNHIDAAENNIIGQILDGLVINHEANKRIENRIIDAVNTGLLINHDANRRIRDTVIGTINESVGSATDIVGGKIGQVVSTIIDGNNSVFDAIDNISDLFKTRTDPIIDSVDSILDVLTDGVKTTINNEIIIPSDVFGVVVGEVGEAVSAAVNGVTTVVSDISNVIGDRIDESIRQGTVFAEQDIDVQTRIAAAVERIGSEQARSTDIWSASGMDGFIGDWLRQGSEYLGESLGSVWDVIKDDVAQRLVQGPLGDSPETDCETADLNAGLLEQTGSGIINWLIGLFVLASAPLTLAQVRSNRILNNYRYCYPDQLMQAGDVLTAMRRGHMSKTEASVILRKHGYDTRTVDILTEFEFDYPPLEILYSLHLRGLIDDGSFKNGIEALGYVGPWRDAIGALEYFIPPPQDLVTMAVREVFDESISRPMGQFDNFPEPFAVFAEQQGISREWAERYWAAHWRLPSEMMGFEMLHRRIIDESELRGLMQALDIMPGWRDRLIALSYKPLTRVDVRRMHALNVITDQEVYNSYLDLGYSPENAERMTKFTIEYNKSDAGPDVKLTTDLTRSAITSAYKDGTLDRESSFALLVAAGIDPASAEVYLLGVDVDLTKRERSLQKSLIMEEYKAGKLSFTSALDLANGLDIETREKQLFVLELQEQEAKRYKMPTKGDLGKFYAAKLLTQNDYIDQMELLGYSAEWAMLYMQLIDKTGDTNE